MRETAKRHLINLTLFFLITSILWPSLLAAHGWKAPPDAAQKMNPVELSKSSIQKGGKIFKKLCAACHGIKARGDGPIAANLNPKPADLVSRLKHHSDGDFFWKIGQGKGSMPSYQGQLSEKQIWNVINFIKSLSSD